MRDAARKAGLVPLLEEDIAVVQDARPWYTCFTNGVYQILVLHKNAAETPFEQGLSALAALLPHSGKGEIAASGLQRLVREPARGRLSFQRPQKALLDVEVHPTVDFVRAGRPL